MNVLLIEDNREDVMQVNQSMAELIDHQDLRVGVVHSIGEGLRAILAKAYDIILLDLSFPSIDSLAGLRRIFDKTNRIPIIVYSNVYSSELAREAIAMGAQDYIIKGSMGKTELVRMLVHAKIRHDVMLKLNDSLANIKALIKMQ